MHKKKIFEVTRINKNNSTGKSIGFFKALSKKEAVIQAAKSVSLSGTDNLRVFNTRTKRK